MDKESSEHSCFQEEPLPPLPHALPVTLEVCTTHADGVRYVRRTEYEDLRQLIHAMSKEELMFVEDCVAQSKGKRLLPKFNKPGHAPGEE